MKFAATLIKIFSGVLSAIVFGVFLYYTYQYQLTQETSNLLIANIALIVFLISSLVFALLFLTFDAYQNKGIGELFIRSLENGSLESNSKQNKIQDILSRISFTEDRANQMLENHFQMLNNGLKSLNNNSTENTTNLQTTLNQLIAICEQISEYVGNIKTENAKEIERNAGHSGNFAVLVSTVSRLSSDINDLNGRLLDVVNQISRNVTTSIQSHTDIDNEIKDLLQKILLTRTDNSQLANQQSDTLAQSSSDKKQTTFSEALETPLPEKANEPQPQSIADFYEERFTQKQNDSEEKSTDIPVEVEEDDDVIQENEQRIDELINSPLQESVLSPEADDKTEHQQEVIIEDNVADDVAQKEEKLPWEEPLSTEIKNAQQEFMSSNDKTSDEFSDNNIINEEPTTPPSLENTSQTSVNVFSETPKNEPHFDEISQNSLQKTDNSAQQEPHFDNFSIVATDPFNPPADYFDEKDTEPVLNIPQEEEKENEVKLDTIFNDNLANELADLDILKDNPSLENNKISVEDLLADEKDPLNPNK